MAKLNKKQQTFIDEYLVDLNATQAAIRAGYSPRTANEQGSRLLANVNVKNEIDKAMAKRSRRTGVNQDRVIRELARIAFVNASNVLNVEDATLRPNASEDDTAAIQSVKVKTFGEDGTEREIKLADKIKALELLGKHLGMYQNNMSLSVQESPKLDAILSQIGGGGIALEE